MKKNRGILKRIFSLLLVCNILLIGIGNTQKVEARVDGEVKGGVNKYSEVRSITDFTDEMKFIFYDFKLKKVKQSGKTYYYATYTPKYVKNKRTVKISKDKMTFSQYAKLFGFKAADCYGTPYQVKGNKDLKCFVIGAVAAFSTRNIHWFAGYLVGTGAGVTANKIILPAGKYRKVATRQELAHPEYRGSKTTVYQSYTSDITIQCWKKNKWVDYCTVSNGPDPFYDGEHLRTYITGKPIVYVH